MTKTSKLFFARAGVEQMFTDPTTASAAAILKAMAEDEAGQPDHQLRVLTDVAGKKLAEKVFDTYVRREDSSYARHPEFLLAFDRLLSEFGGKPIADKSADDQADEDEADFEDGDARDDMGFDEVSTFADQLVKGVVARRKTK